MLRLALLFVLLSSILYSYPSIGGYYGTKATDLVKPTVVKIDETGNIYICDFIGGKIVAFTKDKKIRYVIENLNQPTYISIIDNKMYVTISNRNKIAIFETASGKKVGEFGSYGMKQGEFKHPTLVYQFNKEIYVVDELNFRIQVFDQKNIFLKEILLPKFSYVSKGAYSSNYDITFNKKIMYIMDKTNKKIYKYDLGKNNFKKTEEEIDIKYIADPAKLFIMGSGYYLYDRYSRTFYMYNEDFKYTGEKQVSADKDRESLFANDYEISEDKFHLIMNGDYISYSLKEEKLTKEIDFGSIEDWEYIEPIEVRNDSQGNILVLDRKLERINMYSKEYKFIKNIKNIGRNPTGFFIDEFDNIYIAVAGENMVKKLSPNGDLIYTFGEYGVFNTCFSYYYDSLSDEEKETRKEIKELMILDGGRVFSLKIAVDNKGYIYVLDNSKMKILVFDQFFKYQYEIGKKANIVQMISGKKEDGVFGWNEKAENNLRDMFLYDNRIYIIDNLYKRINVFEGVKFEKKFEDKFSNNVSNIFIKNNVINITDTDAFKVVKYNMKFEKTDQKLFLEDGIMPVWYNGRYIIGKQSKTNYQFFYKVYDLEGNEDDRNKKTESGVEKQKNNRRSKPKN